MSDTQGGTSPPTLEQQLAAANDRIRQLDSERGRLASEVGTLRSSQRVDVPDDAGFDALLTQAKLKPEEVIQSFGTKGSLDPTHYAALKAVGLPKKAVDEALSWRQSIEKQRAIISKMATERLAVEAGGADKLNVTIAHVGKLPESERAEIQGMLSDPERFLDGYRKADAAYKRSIGAEGSTSLIGGGTAASPGGAPFRTLQELNQAKAEASKRSGHWSDDPEFQKRLVATPAHVRQGGSNRGGR